MIAPAKTRVTTPFGQVPGYPLNNGFHSGVDFSYSPDSTIYMPETGVVQLFNWNGKDYNGNYIIVQVGNRRHFMGHIRNGGFLVANGTTVKMGTPIAKMGDTGYAIGAHLHWGLRVDGKVVNGLNYVTGGIDIMDRETVAYIYRAATDTEPTQGQLDYWVGRPSRELSEAIYRANEGFRWRANNYNKVAEELNRVKTSLSTLQTQVDQLVKDQRIKDKVIADQAKEIESLKAQIGDNSKRETFKALIRELFGK